MKFLRILGFLFIIQASSHVFASEDFGGVAMGFAAAAGSNPSDPWESFNRKIFRFNEVLDKYFLRPVAVAYRKVTPRILNEGITNIYNNVGNVSTFLNSLLQGNGTYAAITATRFIFNSTVGVLGFFDVATSFGFPMKMEDFGQTLGVWGVPSGPYVVLPFIGPETVRRIGGRLFDVQYTDASQYIATTWNSYLIYNGLKIVDFRASLLGGESFIVGDKYTFVRNAYLQHRTYLTRNGVVDDPFSDDVLSPSVKDLKF